MLQVGKRISHRFFLAILCIVVIPIGIMGYESHILTKKTLIAFAFQHMATIAESKASHLHSWLEERLDDVGVLSRLPAIREACERYGENLHGPADMGPADMPGDLLEDTLEIIENRSPSYENISVVLSDGRVAASTHTDVAGTQVSEKLAEMKHLQSSDKPIIGPVYQDAGKERWHVWLVGKIEGRQGKTMAFIIAVLDLSKTIDPIMVERAGLGETGETYLVNKDRRIISQSRFIDWGERRDQSFDSHGIVAVTQQKKETAIYDSYMGREVLGSYVWLPRYEWGIVAEMDIEEILRPLKWIKTIGISTTVLVSLICFLMAYVVSRRVSMPIVQVTDAAERMAEGDLEQSIPFSSKDEVGRLAKSFNLMAQQLSQSINSLKLKEESLQKAYNQLVETQEQLLHSERMAAVGELVASVAHEMRSPLSSIRLNLQILGRALKQESILHEHYEIAFDQVMQMERMFSDLLNYSKPLELQKKDISVEKLLGKCLQELDGELASRRIRVMPHIEEDLPPIIGDPDKMEQVLLNVLKNAMEASGQEGQIEVTAREEGNVSAPRVTIAVRDHGVGISARNLKTILQPFFTTKKKGTGLGLAIVKKIMDAHRGEMSVESEEGKGTTVRLTFPSIRGAR